MSDSRGQRKTVTVFGSSEPKAGEPPYQEALRLGELLAQSGFDICNGGYGGTMEAVSRGARAEGARVTGVTSVIFTQRTGANSWIETEISTNNLYHRTKELIDRGDAFIVLPGKAGTLSELTFVWALMRVDEVAAKPIILVGDMWKNFLEIAGQLGILEPKIKAITFLAHSPEEATSHLQEQLQV